VTRWNPCGAVVEFGRYPYTERRTPFRNSDEEVEIVWYPALPSAPDLGMWSNINQESWDRDQWDAYGRPLTTQPVQPWNREKEKPLAFGVHHCGTEQDFREGGVYDPSLPPVEYRPDGLPTCCGLVFVGLGGAVGGGTADVVTEPQPGNACTDAPILAAGTPVVGTLEVGGADQWWTWLPPPGPDARLVASWTGGLLIVRLYWGTPPGCENAFLQWTMNTPGCAPAPAQPSTSPSYVRVSGAGGGTVSYSLVVESGTC